MCDGDGNVSYWEAYVDPLTREPQWDAASLVEIQGLIDEADELILQNTKFDFHALETIGIELPLFSKVKDTLIAGHLLCSNQPHDLTTMVMIYLRKNVQPLENLMEVAVKEAMKIVKREFPEWRLAKKGLEEMPSAKSKTWKYDAWLPRAVAKELGYPDDHDWWDITANYANCDSGSTFALYLRQKDLLISKGLWNIYLSRLSLLESMYKMECNGMAMSRSRTDELYARLVQESDQCASNCIDLADNEIEKLPVNGMSNDLRYVLFDKFGLKPIKKTKKGAPSGDKFVLDHWMATLPEQSRQWKFINNLRRYRRRKTAIGYIESYEKYWLPSDDYDTLVVYPSYNPTGTDTLRFSSQNPNAQQVSKQEDTNTRYCFGPAEGREWWAIDFSNLELRIPAYESNEQEMVFLFEHPDDPPYYGSYHMLVFDTLHPEKFAKHGMDCKKEYADTWYQWTKNGNFAVQYGAVEKSGTADKAYHVPGAQKRIMSRFGNIKKLSRKWIDFANKYGYIETVPDKTVDPTKGYPLYCARTKWNKVLETVPLSYHVQGTAMWIASKAMIRCQAYLDKIQCDAKIIAQVHDEILFDFPVDRGRLYIRILQEIMEKSGDDIGVPLGTTVSYHPNNWAISEDWK